MLQCWLIFLCCLQADILNHVRKSKTNVEKNTIVNSSWLAGMYNSAFVFIIEMLLKLKYFHKEL